MKILKSELIGVLEDIKRKLGTSNLEISNIEFYGESIEISIVRGVFEMEYSLVRDKSDNLKIMTFEV